MNFNGGKENKYMKTHIRKRKHIKISNIWIFETTVCPSANWSFIWSENSVQIRPSFFTKIIYISNQPTLFLVDKGSTYTKLEISNDLLDNYKS